MRRTNGLMVLAAFAVACSTPAIGPGPGPTTPALSTRTSAAERDSLLAVPSPSLTLWCKGERRSLDTTKLVVQLGVPNDTAGWHDMLVLFDTTGVAYMIVVHHEEGPGSGAVHNRGFTVFFLPARSGEWAAQDARGGPIHVEGMNDAEMDHAHALAEWVWSKHCGRRR